MALNESPPALAGRHVTVMGLGRHGGGLAAVRYLIAQGARVTVTDLADESSLAETLAELYDCRLERLHLGGHHEADFRDAEFVVVNPAVKPGNRWVLLARTAGATITSEIELFLDACRAPIIGVTGTVGKSSTCAMLAAMLDGEGRKAWLGGNIGHSLLGDLDTIRSVDNVVLELSSFQLHWLAESTRRPERVLVTRLAPNHLDWHGSWRDYVLAKQRIFGRMRPPLSALLDIESKVDSGSDWFLTPATEVLRAWPDERVPPLRVVGRHQRRNAALAAAMAENCGIPAEKVVNDLRSFAGLPHRLAWVADVAGRRFVNDSKATSPAATIAALDAFESPVWLLAGGVSKGTVLDELARAIVQRSCGAAFFGAAADELLAAVLAIDASFRAVEVDDLTSALDFCWQRSVVGDTILLSPACVSHDQFRDYADRGERFVEAVRNLAR